MGTHVGHVGSSGVTLYGKTMPIGVKLQTKEYPTHIHFGIQAGGSYWKNSSNRQARMHVYLTGDEAGKNRVLIHTMMLGKISSNTKNADFDIDGIPLRGCTLYLQIESDGPIGLRNACDITITTAKDHSKVEGKATGASSAKDPSVSTVDISKIKYSAIAMLTTGKEIYLDEAATNIAWEENENELATRLNITVRDVELDSNAGASGKRLAQCLDLCTAVYLYAEYGGKKNEIFRGTIWEWSHSQVHEDEIVITAYDPLYYLQKSEDYALYSAGQSTKSVCESILEKWGVPLATYNAPTITHEKLALKTKKISAILTTVLDEAKLKLGAGYVIRATKGECEILGQGQNETIWTFGADKNLMTVQDKYSMTNLITKVVILGKEDKDGAQRPPVEATEYGKTEYGTLQKIMTLGSKTIEEAQEEAKQVIAKNGKPERKMQLLAADFPEIRKGDRIRVVTDNVDGYFFVLSVSHNATTQQMQMEAEPV